ncbi:MAG: DUF3108 domain-containing protein [Gallionella sp.]
MIAVLLTPARRIALAIAFSVLIHAAILWLPYIQLPQAKVELPQLSVRLEPLPKPVETIAANPEPGYPLAKSEGGVSAKPKDSAMNAMDGTEQTAAAQPFPKHLKLRFTVYKGADGIRIGEIIQQLDIQGVRYFLKSVRETSGLASLRNSDRLIQASRGRLVATGLQPQIFEEERITKGGKQIMQATFDWTTQTLQFSHGSETALPANAQDVLSFLYQLSQIQMKGEYFPLPVNDGTQLQQYQIEIGAKEEIVTPMGKLRALHLRKMHAQGQAYFEIWLGQEYRLLPVKFRQVDSSNEVTEEIVVSDIRASDE